LSRRQKPTLPLFPLRLRRSTNNSPILDRGETNGASVPPRTPAGEAAGSPDACCDDARYAEALSILTNALTFGIEASLAGITALTRRLGSPQLQYPCIQIAGTNGKSSTTRFAAAFLHAQGKRVGLYTSPELVEYPERMEIDGEVVSHARFADAILTAHEVAQEAIAQGEVEVITEFELLTAAALWLFADERVDFAVLEVGLGGRWDATSVVAPQVAVVTGIDLDHTAILGDNIEQIAAEKAAIIKPGSIPVLGPGTLNTREMFLARCREVGAEPLIVPPPDDASEGEQLPASPRFPSYQRQNIACALVAATAALGHAPSPAGVEAVLNTLSIPGRFELIREQPALLIDASHNPQSARVLAQALGERYGIDPATRRLRTFDTLLLGILADKDAAGIIEVLAPLFSRLVVTQSSSPRAIAAGELANLVAEVGGRQAATYPSVSAALEALSAQGAAVVATGSITLAGEVKAHLV
jgi:dihydrofolate synthase/folylpolyglutamate synthase